MTDDAHRLLTAGDAARIATDIRLALADMLLQPKDERPPTHTVIADAVLPHVERIHARGRIATENHLHATWGRAASEALHALLEQAAELQAQGITVTAGRKHLQDTFSTTMEAACRPAER